MLRKWFLVALVAFPAMGFALPGHVTRGGEASTDVLLRVNEETGKVEIQNDEGIWTVAEAVSYQDPRLIAAVDYQDDSAQVQKTGGDLDLNDGYGYGYDDRYQGGYARGYGGGGYGDSFAPCVQQQIAAPCCGGCQSAVPYYQIPDHPYVYSTPPVFEGPPIVYAPPPPRFVRPRVYYVRPRRVVRHVRPFTLYSYPRYFDRGW